MPDEEQPSRGFTVVDRRSAAQEEAQPAQASATPEKPPSASAPPASAPPENAAPENAAQASAQTDAAASRPPVDFSSFVISLASSALYHLGLLPDPQTKKPGEKNLPLARHTIDTLALLQQKTAGNLSAEESKLLGDLLVELRMRFVEASRN